MKIVFMGTPEFAVPTLDALTKHHNVLVVITQPDRPAGRGHKLQPSPVKSKAEELNIPVLQPTSLHINESKEIRALLKSYDADIFVVAAYGLLLPKGILNMPRLGCINVHASLLPKYRGASPIHAALLNGDKETGITIMHMEAGIDTGDMIIKKSTEIGEDERFPSLHNRLAEIGGELILEAIDLLEKGVAPREKQDNNLSSYASMIKKQDGLIDWNRTTAEIINKVRAFDPWPGVFTDYQGQMIKIWSLEATSPDNTLGLVIKTGDGAVKITEVQPIGGKRMPTLDYLRGRRPHKA